MIQIEQRKAKESESKKQLPATSEEFRVTTESTSNFDSSPVMGKTTNFSGIAGRIMNTFYLKGTKASISSTASNKFQQLKQR